MLSTLKKNKQVVHLVTELVILTSLVIYFKNRYNTLQKHINLLAERVEEQAGILYRQQDQIQRLLNYINKSRSPNIVVTKVSPPVKKSPPLEPILELTEKKEEKKEKKNEKKEEKKKKEAEISDTEIEKELKELEEEPEM